MGIVSNISTSFVLLGLVELKGHEYLYCVLSTMAYLFIITLSIIIVFVVLTDQSLHQPMYILIGNLVFNGIFGSSSLFPKLIVDLVTSAKTISHDNCIIQCGAVALFAILEMSTFTLMAYDRYLAVCHPLHYVTLMTNTKVIKFIVGCWVSSFLLVFVGIFLTWSLPLCEDKINNIICENMSLVILSCVDSSISRLFSATGMVTYFIVTLLVTGFSYLKIFITCSNLSKESRQKAFHVLVTHLINFSIFIIGVLFIVIRYRLGNFQLSLAFHVLFSITPLVFPPLFNPLIYGIRTHALRIKVLKHFQKLKAWGKMLKELFTPTVLKSAWTK